MNNISTIVHRNGAYVPVELQQSHNKLGVSEELDKYVKEQMQLSINEVKDMEAVRFKSKAPANFQLIPQFKKGISFGNSFTYAGFTSNKVRQFSSSLINSMFIFEYFDSPLQDIQKRISYNFVKVDSSGVYENIPALGEVTDRVAKLNFGESSTLREFNTIYVPSYIYKEGIIDKLYMKVSFFNGETGKRLFFMNETSNLEGDSKYYVPVNLNLSNKTYTLNGANNRIDLKEYVQAVAITKDNENNKARTIITTKRGKVSELLTGVLKEKETESGIPTGFVTGVTMSNSTLYRGSTNTLTWGNIDATKNVKISLIWADEYSEYVISESTPSTGSYTFVNDFNSVGKPLYNYSGMTREAYFRVQLVGDEYDAAMTDSILFSSMDFPPIVWGTPEVSVKDWNKNGVYRVTHNSPQTGDYTNMQYMTVYPFIRYTDKFGNYVDKIATRATYDIHPTGYTDIWATEWTMFAGDEAKGFVEVEIYLKDMYYPENTFSLGTIKYYNTTYSGSTYNAYSTEPQTITPLNLGAFTKPLSASTIYTDSEYQASWSGSAPSSRFLKLWYAYYSVTEKAWKRNVLSSGWEGFEGDKNPYIFRYEPYEATIKEMLGDIVDGYMILTDETYSPSNMIKTPVVLNKFGRPVIPQSGLTLNSTTVSSYNFYSGETYTINWQVPNNDTIVDVDLIYTSVNGALRTHKIRTKILNSGTTNYIYDFTELTFDSPTTAIIRIRDPFDVNKKMDTATQINMYIPNNYYYDLGYNVGKFFGNADGSTADCKPPQNCTPNQEVEYCNGFNQGQLEANRGEFQSQM
jgi:hypothetical protein